MAGNRYLVIVLNSEVPRIKILRFASIKLSVSENKSWSIREKHQERVIILDQLCFQ